MFKPSEEKSNATKELLMKVFKECVENAGDYTVCYAYFMKNGLFRKTMFSYVLGFSESKNEIVLIQIDTNGNKGEMNVINSDNIVSIKNGLQGDTIIKTKDSNKPIKILVPGYTPTSLEAAYILPINQMDEAINFKNFTKKFK